MERVKAAKLSSNENPLGTAPSVREAFASAANTLDRYPDAGAVALREAIGAHYGVDPARVIHGTGSDEVLHLAGIDTGLVHDPRAGRAFGLRGLGRSCVARTIA